jgi:hypothetical protein
VIGVAAWTKADAQNVNFAIPIQEFNQLRVSKPPATWDQLNAAPQLPPSTTLIPARQSARQAIVGEVPAGDYSAFRKWLDESAGEPVTIMVQETGQTNVYHFTIK